MSDGSKKQWVGKRNAQPVSDLVSKLLDPVIEQRAGMTLDLIASWDEIVGSRHARNSRPEKLMWPKQATDDDPFEPATLVIACESAHVLFLQHDTTSVINRINGYFGFSAVAKVKLIQKPLPERDVVRSKKNKPLALDMQSKLTKSLENIEEGPLKDALRKMGEGVFSKGS